MTDKTKLRLTAKHPEAVLCKKAGKELLKELGEKFGIDKFNGVGVTLSTDEQEAAIHLLLLDKSLLNQIPTIFKGYEVKTTISGPIKAL